MCMLAYVSVLSYLYVLAFRYVKHSLHQMYLQGSQQFESTIVTLSGDVTLLSGERPNGVGSHLRKHRFFRLN